MANPQQTVEKIKKIQIQGARAIAVASLNSLKSLAKDKSAGKKELLTKVSRAIDQLKKARPTEPLNQNCLNFVKSQLKIYQASRIDQLKNVLNDSVNFLLNQLTSTDQEIISNGEKIIKSGQNIFTHCHSSTVEGILKSAWQHQKRFKVFNTETRPLFQGRITAKNLSRAKIPVTMVADNAASFLISETSGKDLMMGLVLLGADAILPDGSVINKIGSFGISQSAYFEKVPLYIVASLLKYDSDGIVPIEIRPSKEIWPQKPKGLKIINFAFDTVPAKYITGLVCEFGVIKPSQVKKLVRKNYPWLI